jgi:hypothetical protein
VLEPTFGLHFAFPVGGHLADKNPGVASFVKPAWSGLKIYIVTLRKSASISRAGATAFRPRETPAWHTARA